MFLTASSGSVIPLGNLEEGEILTMAKIYEISARFMRRVQVKEYEPVEAEFTLKAQTEDGDDPVALMAQLGEQVRHAVLSTIKGKFDSTSQPMPADVAEAKATPAAEAPKANGKTNGSIAPAAASSDMPDETETPAAAEKPKRGRPAGAKGKKAEASSAMPDEDEGEAKAEASSSDMPDETPAAKADAEDWENAAAEEEEVTAATLTAFISKQVSASKITVPDVKAILAKYGAARCADLKPGDLPKAKAEITDFSKV